MKRNRTVFAIGLCALLLLGCTAPQIINSDPKQDKIQIIGEIVHETTAPSEAPDVDIHVSDPAAPTTEPTPEPTEAPTEVPTEEPTEAPTSEPTPEPTEEPTPSPTPTPNRTKAEAFAEEALSLIDLPYRRGGTDADGGFDPGGFVYYCLNKTGLKVKHKTSKGYSEVDEWQRVESMDDLAVGDLCFFRTPGNDAVNCVTIYLGDGKMIYPSSGEGKVITAKIQTNYWEESFVFARRGF